MSDEDEGSVHGSPNLYQTTRYTSATNASAQGAVTSQNHSTTKWNRLSSKYNDQYLELFNTSWASSVPDEYLEESQFGTVIWTGPEKARLFEALGRKGRHDLPSLAGAVETKSQVEIRDYLLRVQEAGDDRQRFSRNTKNATQVDIDAAVEISEDVENELEDSADALAAFQDAYDYSAARSRDPDTWLITTELAESLAQLDHETTTAEEEEEGDPDVLEFFKFNTMLDLSRSLFMNMAEEAEHDHWHEYAESDEEPSLMLEAARDLYKIVKGLTQRILQAAIFLTESRLRATATAEYVPSRILKDTDVVAALGILNLPVNSFDYWCEYTQRSGLNIVLGIHRKGQASAPISVEQAKVLLSARRGREGHISISDILADSPQQASPLPKADSEFENESGTESEITESATHSDSDSSKSSKHIQSARMTGHAIHRQRRADSEAAEDDFVEKLDHQASIREEHLLRARLGHKNHASDSIDEDNSGRPKKLRKLKEDLNDWSTNSYLASWEQDYTNSNVEITTTDVQD